MEGKGDTFFSKKRIRGRAWVRVVRGKNLVRIGIRV
jgi:hypothetical protein